MVILPRDESTDADGAFRAGLVFDHDRFAPFLRKPIRKYPGGRIVGAAGRKRHDQLHRALGPTRTGSKGKNKNTGDRHNQGNGSRPESLFLRTRFEFGDDLPKSE